MASKSAKNATESRRAGGGLKRKKKAGLAGKPRKRWKIGSEDGATPGEVHLVGLEGDEIVDDVGSPRQALEGEEGDCSERMALLTWRIWEVLIDGVDVSVPVKAPSTPPACIATPPIHGKPSGGSREQPKEPVAPDGGYACENGSVRYTNASSFESSRLLQPHEDAEVLEEVMGQEEGIEQEFAPGDESGSDQEPYLSENTSLGSRYRILKILGHGNFSTTYLAEETPTEPEPPDIPPKVVAIKRLKQPYALIGENEFMLLEFLHGEKPRHIISPIASFVSETNHFHLVLEPLDSARPLSLPKCCCISRSVHSSLACSLRHLSLAKVLVQLLSGLLSLHSHNLIHADLTPANVLFLPSSNRIKLIDLGNAIRPEDREAYLDDFGVQSACYRAPEILLGSGPLSRVMDIWSAGVIAVELLLDGEIIGKGQEGAELMRCGIIGREALVWRTVELVGSVMEYGGGVYYTDIYDEISLESVEGKLEGLRMEKRGILREFLEDATEDVDLVDFLVDMMEVGVGRRKTVAEMLKHPWLVGQLLGDWGNVLMGGMEDDNRRGYVDDVQDQLELGVLEGENDFDDIRRSGEGEDIPEYDGLPLLDGQQGGEDLGQFLGVGCYEDIRNQPTDRVESDSRPPSPHSSLWEDISDPPTPSPERELQFVWVRREGSADRLEPGFLPPPAGGSPSCHSPRAAISTLGCQSQFEEEMRERPSGLIDFRFGEEGKADYPDNPREEDTNNSIPETSLITNGNTTSITLRRNEFSSPPPSPRLPAPLLLEGVPTPTRTPEICSPSHVGLVGRVDQAEKVESVPLLDMNKGDVARRVSDVWHRDLAADMVWLSMYISYLMSKLG